MLDISNTMLYYSNMESKYYHEKTICFEKKCAE